MLKILCRYMLELPQFQRVSTTYDSVIYRIVMKLKLAMYDNSLQHAKLSINVKIPVTIWPIVHINKINIAAIHQI